METFLYILGAVVVSPFIIFYIAKLATYGSLSAKKLFAEQQQKQNNKPTK